MANPSDTGNAARWLSVFPPARWLAEYRMAWLPSDLVAGITLAAYAIPVSLAYAALAGLPPQVGVYGYLLGGLGSSGQLAIGPTSAISLMIAATVGAMAEGDALRYAQIASLAGFTVALLCVLAWLLRLSALVKLISDSILVGFKAGAGLTIAMTQLPSLLGVSGGGHNLFERDVTLIGQLGQIHSLVLAVGAIAILLLVLGGHWLPGRPVALGVVALAIVAASVLGLPAMGLPTTGEIPSGLPTLEGPALRLRDIDGIVPLAAGCLLLAYIEGVSAARAFAAKHDYALDPRQEFLGLNADAVHESVLDRLRAFGTSGVRLVVCDLSASPYVDLAGSRMLQDLHDELASRGIALRIVGAHGWARDLLRADGLVAKAGEVERTITLHDVVAADAPPVAAATGGR